VLRTYSWQTAASWRRRVPGAHPAARLVAQRIPESMGLLRDGATPRRWPPHGRRLPQVAGGCAPPQCGDYDAVISPSGGVQTLGMVPVTRTCSRQVAKIAIQVHFVAMLMVEGDGCRHGWGWSMRSGWA